MKDVKHTEGSLQRLIGKRYSAPAFATLLHVRNQTGFRRTVRTADALTMSLYPSRGLEVMGFEIKCSRTDWKKELEDPTKAEEILRFCDRWWVVVADNMIVQPGELPPTWGLLEAKKDCLVCKAEAPKLTPQTISREFLAGILRNVTETNVPRASMSDELEARYKAGFDYGVKTGQRDAGRAPRELAELQKTVAEFKEASGIKLESWDAGEVGKAVRLLVDLQTRGFGGFEGIANSADQIAQTARDAHAEISKRGPTRIAAPENGKCENPHESGVFS